MRFSLLLFSLALHAQTTPTYGVNGITISTKTPQGTTKTTVSSVNAGQMFNIETVITASTPGWESLQWKVNITNATITAVYADPAAVMAGKYLTCDTSFNCIAISGQVINGQMTNTGVHVINSNLLIADYTAIAAATGTITVSFSPITLADSSGGALPVLVGSTYMIPIVAAAKANFCDLSGPGGFPDGVVNDYDSAEEINRITNGGAWDRFGDNNPARSSQAVLYASMGNACTATQ